MYFMDTKEHNTPHIHVRYQDFRCVYAIPSGDVLAGELPPQKHKLAVAWIAIHADELMADWQLALEGKELFRIEPLR